LKSIRNNSGIRKAGISTKSKNRKCIPEVTFDLPVKFVHKIRPAQLSCLQSVISFLLQVPEIFHCLKFLVQPLLHLGKLLGAMLLNFFPNFGDLRLAGVNNLLNLESMSMLHLGKLLLQPGSFLLLLLELSLVLGRDGFFLTCGQIKDQRV
jgi:hypothetical protein